MVSHSSHTNHDFFILVIGVANVSFAIESFALTKKEKIKVKIRKKTLFLSSIIENNVFSLCKSQNTSDFRNFSLF